MSTKELKNFGIKIQQEETVWTNHILVVNAESEEVAKNIVNNIIENGDNPFEVYDSIKVNGYETILTEDKFWLPEDGANFEINKKLKTLSKELVEKNVTFDLNISKVRLIKMQEGENDNGASIYRTNASDKLIKEAIAYAQNIADKDDNFDHYWENLENYLYLKGNYFLKEILDDSITLFKY